jgi:hypothetical protein
MTTPQVATTEGSNSSLRRSKFSIYALLGVPSTPSSPASQKFDADHKFVTSPVFRNPFVFGGLRLLTAFYTLITLTVMIAIYEIRFETGSRYVPPLSSVPA